MLSLQIAEKITKEMKELVQVTAQMQQLLSSLDNTGRRDALYGNS